MKWVSATVCFLVGIAATLVTLLLIRFRFNWEFKVTDVLQLVVTVIIAFLIQKFATETYSDKRVAKNLLISRVEETISYFQDVHKIFLECVRDGQVSKENSAAILTLTKNINNSIKRLEHGLGKCRMEAPSFKAVTGSRRDYHRTLTGGGFPSHPYTVAVFAEENDFYNAITQDLESMIYEINNW
jgi:hypothetical protein